MTTARTPWIVTALMALGTYTSMFAVSTLVSSGGWLRTVFVVLAVTMTASLVVRALSRSRFLPTLAAAVVAIIVMVPLFAVDEEGNNSLSITDLWRVFGEGAEYAAGTPAPAEATTPLVALLTVFAVAVFTVADHLAASWRAVAVSGVVLMLPWTPAIFLQYQVPMWALFATAACWMVAMGAARSPIVTARTAPLTGPILAACSALVLTVLVVPAALGGNGWGAIPRLDAPDSLETSTRLNLALDLRNSLTVNSNQIVMTYVTTGKHPDTLRLYTYRDFDGSTWTREKADPTDTVPANGKVLWPRGVNAWNDQVQVILSITVSRLAERNLPIPTQPRSVSVDGSWTYSPSRDEVTTEGAGTKGLDYSVVTAPDYFTAENLQAAQGAIDADESPVSPIYTEVPTSVDLARLQSVARDVTGDATTQYAQAVALQNYLRDPNNFTYDTSVSPDDGGDAVSTFLDDRTGYCVQFATAMVMLSRSLGIPARIAVGFLGGHLTDGGVWAVRSGDAHAWPELYFPGEGWVRFEPTPAVQTGNPPSYTVERTDTGNAPIPSNVPIPSAIPSAPTETFGPTISGPTEHTPDAGVPWWLVTAVIVAIVGAGAAVWTLRRRSAARTAAHGPEAAWASLREQLPEPLRWSPALTPLEAAHGLQEALLDADDPLTEAGQRALAELRDAVSDLRYAPPGAPEPEPQWLTERVTLVVQEVTRSRPDRVGARSGPRRDS